MKRLFAVDVGIKIWEKSRGIADYGYSTLTVAADSMAELSDIFFEIVRVLDDEFPQRVKWRSFGYPLQSKILELKLLSGVRNSLVAGGVIKKNENTNIYSYVQPVLEIFSVSDFMSLGQARYTMILFERRFSELDLLWGVCRDADIGVSDSALHEILKKLGGGVVCRIFEADKFAVAQFFGAISVIDKLGSDISMLGFKRASQEAILTM